MAEIKNFWNGDHPLAAKATELFEALVPGQGDAATLQGELIRAATRISYDWYNNGWGCNNWSGAVQFILKRIGDLPVKPSDEIMATLRKNLAIASDYSHGEPCHISDDRADEVVTSIQEIVVQAIIENPELIHNATGMFEYSEPDYRGSYDDEDDESGW